MHNYFHPSRDVASSGSDELSPAQISNLQDIVTPHPNLVDRMYFV